MGSTPPRAAAPLAVEIDDQRAGHARRAGAARVRPAASGYRSSCRSRRSHRWPRGSVCALGLEVELLDGDVQRFRLLVANDLHRHCRTRLRAHDVLHEIGAFLHRLAVVLDDDVAGLEARLAAGVSSVDLPDHGAVTIRQTEGLGGFRRNPGWLTLQRQADAPARHLAAAAVPAAARERC